MVRLALDSVQESKVKHSIWSAFLLLPRYEFEHGAVYAVDFVGGGKLAKRVAKRW
jgi:hypothetical protein